MPVWIIAAAIGSIVITALLTFALWRMNRPMLDRHKSGDGGGDGGGYAPSHDRHDTSDSYDGGSDGGGGDGGGD